MIMPFNDIANKYIDCLSNEVCKIISKNINLQNVEDLVNEHFTNRLEGKANGTKFRNFHSYYFRTINNKVEFQKSNFFSEFIQKYSLRGIDNTRIESFESKKNELISMIETDKLADLYFNHFACVEIKNNDKVIEKNLGSFFTKIVHTFRPEEYTPIDNAIKKFFGLAGESYFIAMIVISNAYLKWANEHRKKMEELKRQLSKEIKENLNGMVTNEITKSITDMKLLNILFWSIAEKKVRIGSL